MSDKITVICPTYNSEKFISLTINSIINQKKHPEEIIFIDDGSSDNTVKKINTFKGIFNSLNIEIEIFQSNHRGPGNARNIGIINSKYDWISFLDSDDLWSEDKIYHVKNTINNSSNTNFIVHWENMNQNKKNIILKHGSKYDLKKKLQSQIFKNNFISTSAVTCKKKLLINNLFDEKLKISQDYELWLRMSPEINLSVIEIPLGEYIIRDNSITKSFYGKRLFYLWKILIRHRHKSNFQTLIQRLARSLITIQWIK